MTMIATVSPQNAAGKVAAIYSQIEGAVGYVPNAMRAYSSSPDVLENVWSQIAYYLEHPSLSFPLAAVIRMLVSEKQQCEYCVGFNEALLINHADWTHEQVADVLKDRASVPFNEKDKAMLFYVLDAVKTPKQMDKARLDTLHELGWSDREILDAVNLAAQNIAEDLVFNTFRITVDY